MAQGLIGNFLLPTYAPGRRNMSFRHDRFWPDQFSRIDLRWGGLFNVPGTTEVAGNPDVPVKRRVVLFDAVTRLPARSLVSDASGAYVFNNVARGPWFVVSFDHTGEYNAVIADNIYGVPM